MGYGSESSNSNLWWLLALIVVIIVVIIIIAAANSDDNGDHQRDVNFTVPEINSSLVIPPSDAKGTGKGSGVLSADRSTFHYNIVVNNICDITAAYFRYGAAGENGPPAKKVHFRQTHKGTWQASGNWANSDETEPLDQVAVDELLANRVYINIHTRKNPSGAIRGQVQVAPS